MANLVRNYLLLCFIGTACTICQGQSGWPTPRFRLLVIDKTTGEKDDIFSFLEKNVPRPEENNCIATWGVFYFRVTVKGKIDSLFHEGTLRNTVTRQIIKNIYATQSHWEIPKGTRAVDKLWFVYPYFDLGYSHRFYNKCSEGDKLLQRNMIELAENIGKICAYSGIKGTYFMHPSITGAEYIDKTIGEKDDLFSFLKKNIPGSEENSCRATWGVFYFRVTGKGKIDTLYHEETLREEVTSQIIKNIYVSGKHWKIPKDTRATDKLWFVYPYFDLGCKSYLGSDCPEAEKLVQKNVMELAESMKKICFYTETKGAYFIPPSMTGAEYHKE
ncbi:hypothetical protein [Dyadobacter diqingensis]|uniref:hypothetical protein n=1 Tax=Dyadobacter diqingensis TaxID=2938121 RepID=UPI0020C56B28|nr:hypothetical protein [Dyadobacter diqingensis]